MDGKVPPIHPDRVNRIRDTIDIIKNHPPCPRPLPIRSNNNIKPINTPIRKHYADTTIPIPIPIHPLHPQHPHPKSKPSTTPHTNPMQKLTKNSLIISQSVVKFCSLLPVLLGGKHPPTLCLGCRRVAGLVLGQIARGRLLRDP